MKFFLVFALSLFSFVAQASFDSRRVQEEVKADFESNNALLLAERTNLALDALVKTAAKAMRKKGYLSQAERIEFEWQEEWNRFLPFLVQAKQLGLLPEDIGDHNPLSVWLANWYLEIEAILGEPLCKLLHLDDINTFNFTMPVVFNLKKILGQDPIDLPEYSLHWVPFAGIVSYWSVFIACEIATFGSGWVLVCTPSGMLAEHLTVKFVAPPLSDNMYNLFWQQL